MQRRYIEAVIDSQTLYRGTFLVLRTLVLLSPLRSVFVWTTNDLHRQSFLKRLANINKSLDNVLGIRKTRPTNLATQ